MGYRVEKRRGGVQSGKEEGWGRRGGAQSGEEEGWGRRGGAQSGGEEEGWG